MKKDSPVDQKSRRKFVKTVAYVAPVVVTLSALPSFASAGSPYRNHKGNEGVGNGYDNPPPGHWPTNYNDYEGTGPGNPGHQHPRRFFSYRRR